MSPAHGKYSSTTLPFLIQLLLLNFHDVPDEILNISTMCTRSVRRVMQLVAWMNAVWRSSFRQIHIEHWQHFPWLVWHPSPKFCWYISSLMWLELSHLTIIGKQKSDMLVIVTPDSNSWPFAWSVRPLHLHRWIITSHNLVTEIKEKLICSTIGTQIAFHRDITSNIQICLFIRLLTQEPSPCLRPNPILIWWLAGEAIWKGHMLHVQQASLSGKVINWALRWAQNRVYSCSTAASQNLASYDWFQVKRSLVAFPIFRGWCQDTPSALQLLPVQVTLYQHPSAVEQLPEPSIWICHTPYLIYRSVGCMLPSRLCQLVKLHLLLSKSLHALLHRVGDCAHHPAGFVIFAQLALLCLFINLIFPILPMVGTCKFTQTVSDINRHLKKRFFALSGHLSRVFSCLCIFSLLPDRCHCIFNSLSCPSGFSLNIILDQFFFLFIAQEVHFSSFLGHKFLFGSHAA